MRNLTLTRKKSYVGCLMADQVYIRDAMAAEITIQGVPCRKLGTLKNGETKTFQIEDGEQRIFLIADKVSKNYCNAALTIPEGQEDVAYTGKHEFSLGNNSFVFEGVELTAEEKANQKRNNRKGTIVFIAAIVVGLAIGRLAVNGIFNEKAKDKTFTKEDFSITLTDEFTEEQYEDMFVAYETNAVAVFVVRDDFSVIGNITLDEYAELSLEANARTGLESHKENGYVWFSYVDTVDGEDYYYFAALYKGEKAFWAVSFTTFKDKADQYHSTFKKWAATINVGVPAGTEYI